MYKNKNQHPYTRILYLYNFVLLRPYTVRSVYVDIQIQESSVKIVGLFIAETYAEAEEYLPIIRQ